MRLLLVAVPQDHAPDDVVVARHNLGPVGFVLRGQNVFPTETVEPLDGNPGIVAGQLLDYNHLADEVGGVTLGGIYDDDVALLKLPGTAQKINISSEKAA